MKKFKDLAGKNLKYSFIEKTFISKEGFPCMVVFTQMHRCGYVFLPPTHRYYQKDYESIDINCHGGLTYSNSIKKFLPELELFNLFKNYWVIGFDCGHYVNNDSEDLETAIKYFGDNNELLLKLSKFKKIISNNENLQSHGTIKTMEFVEKELRNMTSDLSKNE